MAKEFQIGMLWVKGALSFLEQLCIKSFLDAGQSVRLYTYEPVENVPDNVELRDARDVLPNTDFVTHTRTGSVAPHADKFRYRMLSKEPDLIWADTDAYCVKPFTTENGHFHGWLAPHEINNGVLRLPSDSDVLRELIEYTEDEYRIPPWLPRQWIRKLEAEQSRGTPVSAGDMPWGVWGPRALTYLLHKHGEEKFALPSHVLYPVPYGRRRMMARPNRNTDQFMHPDTASIHLYGRRMRSFLHVTYDGTPHPDSLIGKLVEKHGIDAAAAPTRDKARVAEEEAARQAREKIAE